MSTASLEGRVKNLEISLIGIETQASRREAAIIDALSASLRINMNLLLSIAAAADSNQKQLTEYSEATISAMNEMSDKIDELLKEKKSHVDELEIRMNRLIGDANE